MTGQRMDDNQGLDSVPADEWRSLRANLVGDRSTALVLNRGGNFLERPDHEIRAAGVAAPTKLGLRRLNDDRIADFLVGGEPPHWSSRDVTKERCRVVGSDEPILEKSSATRAGEVSRGARMPRLTFPSSEVALPPIR
jgi:hypothetical protein